MSVGSCKHNEHWGIVFESTSKTVFHLLLAFVYLYTMGVITQIVNTCVQPQLPVIVSNYSQDAAPNYSQRIEWW